MDLRVTGYRGHGAAWHDLPGTVTARLLLATTVLIDELVSPFPFDESALPALNG